MRNLIKPLIFCTPLVLAACGGGGGSGGDSNLQYSIKLTASKTSVPVNLSGAYPQYPESVDYYPYMSTLYVQAYEGSAPISSQVEEPFGCNVVSGLDSGSLFYLDGKDEHTVEVDYKGEKIKVPGSYRSITLGSNSGGNSFHVISSGIAGDVVVKCTVTDPRDNKVYSATTTVKVGGGSTATPAGVTYSTPQAQYVGSRDNVNNIPNQIAIEATVRNDNNQPITNAGKPNLQVSIVPTTNSTGARLMAGGANSAGSMQVSTVNGVGQFSLASGPASGALLLKMTADRADNDVSNGIQDPVFQYAVVSVVDAIATTPLALDPVQLSSLVIENAQPFYAVLSATGGVPAYTFTAMAGMPTGLTLSSSGVLQGTPWVTKPGDYNVTVKVTDSTGVSVTQQMKLTITGELPATPVAFDIAGCSGGLNTACPLPAAAVGSGYAYAFTATGGGTITWTYQGLPSWLSQSTAGGSGLVAATEPLACDSVGTARFFVTASNATNSVTRQVSINVASNDSCTVTPTTP